MIKEEIINKLIEGGKLLPIMTEFEAEEVVNLVIDNLFNDIYGIDEAASNSANENAYMNEWVHESEVDDILDTYKTVFKEGINWLIEYIKK